MNQFVRRIFAGVSAVILSVSAIDSDTLIGNFRQTIRADSAGSTQKKGSDDTSLFEAEKDTIVSGADKIYNTNYGLHTDKTVSKAYDDGRTFDLDLESWYIGEKPVDVGLVLDASGSMAWTTNTLFPLEVDTELSADEQEYLNSKYGKNNLIDIQNDNGGYLPQDVVDLILDNTKTDNTKLGYDKYKYYVYEDRPSVSEFVPLGYWDGGSPLIDDSLIGYYPFNGNLNNEAPNAVADAKGSYIAQPTSRIFDSEVKATTTPQAVFSDGYLDLSETDKNGNIVIDLSGKLNVEKSITISFTLKCDQLGGTGHEQLVPQSPILYLGDGSSTNYIALMRGRAHTGTGASNHIYVYDSNDKLPAYKDGSVMKDSKDKETGDNKFLDGKYGEDIACSLKISVDATDNRYIIELSDENSTNTFTYYTNDIDTLKSEKLYLVLGGDEILDKGTLTGENGGVSYTISPDNLKGNKIKTLKISGFAPDGTEFNDNFALDSALDLNGTNLTAEYKKQGNIGDTNLSFEAQTGVEAEVQYADNALNLTQTAKYGAILLDKKPTDSSFTLSFKVKKAGTDEKPTPESNILYMGSMNTNNDYYRIFRGADGNASRLRMQKNNSGENKYVNVNSVFSNGKDYQQVTLVFNGKKIEQYLDGIAYKETGSNPQTNTELPEAIDTTDLSLLLGGLFDSSYSGAEIYIDDFYIFDNALTEKQVNYYFGDSSVSGISENESEKCKAGAAHAVTLDETEIAQIAKTSSKDETDYSRTRLADNPNHEDRRGWYYVNSHSNWEDIDGCLASGKQYIGILKELPATAKDGGSKGDKFAQHNDTATIPSAYAEGSEEKDSITNGDTNEVNKYKPPTTERSIRFYVDDVGHLRCFAWSGNDSKEGDQRTFCSVVYTNDDGKGGNKSELKYQTLNTALNTFFTELHKKSSFSNVSAVRFSLEALVDKKEEELEKLKMLNWVQPTEETLPKGLISPRYPEENSNSAGNSGDGQYNYVMTGGTYTWTGLRSFYENLRNDEKVRDNGRPKYLIIFTDGRDNLADTNSNYKYTHEKDASNKLYENSIGNFAPCTDDEKTETQLNLSDDSQLAGAWAKKLKDAGYTIYCVMLATGSISPTANEDEYNRAANFLATLAGDKETSIESKEDKNFDKYVFISDPSVNDEKSSLKYKFQQILDNMSSSLTNYTVQDYIDPRFDLVDRDGNILKLGAGGKITGESLKEPKTVTDEIGFEYTPKDTSYGGGTVNETTGDTTATVYYDSTKDMYYLRWKVDSIGGGNTPFTTGSGSAQQYLAESSKEQDGMWHCTITVKAKDDFIGGNAILTNGNEAGMNLVFSENSLNSDTTLTDLSGTDRADDKATSGADISPSKGFPRVCVNVRLLPIQTKPLSEVIYLGELVSPSEMLNKIENDYMSGSYYLEYLQRYAYRLDSTSGKDPIMTLLNEWLGIESTEKIKSFTIPYIYLPNPYNADGEFKDVKQNNVGTSDWNQKDIVGFITYTWKRVDPNNITEVYSEADDFMKDFIANEATRIEYSLELKFTPLPEDSKTLEELFKDDFTLGGKFITDDDFFKIEDEEFKKIEDTSDKKWTFGTRDEYLKALVNETDKDKNPVYEWDSDYKPTAGTKQVDEKQNYGDAIVKDNSLIASTTYTKDVVNAGLALEMIVKGSDLKDSETVAKDKTFTFQATRNYDDTNELSKATNEVYKLTFQVAGDIPTDIKEDEHYTIWATLDSVQVPANGVTSPSIGKAEDWTNSKYGTSLPIGTYTISYNGDIVINTSSGAESTEVKFTDFTADNNKNSFVYNRFPSDVYNVSKWAIRDDSQDDYEYLIYHDGSTEKSDYSKQNIAKNEKVTPSDNQTLKFYFGTGTDNKKGSTDKGNEYTKDRLGILLLSSGEKYLTISKEVTNSSEKVVLDNKWKFDLKLIDKNSSTGEETTEINVRWSKNGETVTGTNDSYPTKIKFKKAADSNEYIPVDDDGNKILISLADGESLTINQLSGEWEYEVSEIRDDQIETNGFKDLYRYKMLIEDGDTNGTTVKAVNSDDTVITDSGIPTDNGKSVTSSGTVELNSYVHFTNDFPVIELPSTGGNGGIDITLYCDIMLVVAAGLYLTILFCKKCRKRHEMEG